MVSLGVFMLTVAVLGALVIERWRSSPLVPVDPAPPAQGRVLRAASQVRDASVTGESERFSGIDSLLSQARLPKLLGLRAGCVAGTLLLVTGQMGLNGGNPTTLAVASWFVGLALLVLVEWQTSAIALPERPLESQPWVRPAIERWRWPALAPVVLASYYIIEETPKRLSTDSSMDIVLLWLLSICALVVASGAVPTSVSRPNLGSLLWEHRIGMFLAFAVLAFAAVPRFFNLSSYAWSMSGDEGTFGTTALSTLNGTLRNPFSSGPWGYPSLLFIVQGWFVDLFDGTVSGARTLSALFGIGSVFAIWLLVREHFGRYPALLAALICGSMNLHVYWSRDAQNASAPMFFLPLALLFLDRGLVGGSRAYSVAAGLTIAFAQFFHPSNRLLLPMAVVYLVYALIVRAWSAREISLSAWGKSLSSGLWATIAVIVGHLPLIAHFEVNRVEYWSRTNEVSVFASGWLDQEKVITGDSAIEIMSRQLWNAIMLPFSFVPHGHYKPGSPLTGWPLAIFVAFGLALVTVWFLRRSYFPFALGFWVVTVGLAFTNGPPMTNRYTAAAPFLAALGAIGLWGFASLASKLARLARPIVLSVATAIAVFIVFWNFNFYFKDPNQVDLYSDANSQLANYVARQAETLGDGAIVYLAGLPRLYYYGFQNIPYIAPNAVGIDVDPMWDSSQTPPELSGPTLFVFIPERMSELDVVRSWFPNGSQTVRTLPDGSTLYASYLVEPQSGSNARSAGWLPGVPTVPDA